MLIIANHQDKHEVKNKNSHSPLVVKENLSNLAVKKKNNETLRKKKKLRNKRVKKRKLSITFVQDLHSLVKPLVIARSIEIIKILYDSKAIDRMFISPAKFCWIFMGIVTNHWSIINHNFCNILKGH